MRNKALLFLGMLAMGSVARAQVSVTASALTYTQNFDNLDTANVNSSNLPVGWSIFEYGTSATTVNNQYKGNDGSSTTGETYSYGSSGSTERSLGSLASNALGSYYGVRFTNNTGSTITGFTVAYKGEQWRLGTATAHTDTLRFQYSTAATGVSDTTTTTSWITDNGLTFVSPVTTGTVGPLVGNTSFTNKTGNIGVIIASGGSVTLRWADVNITGSDDGLALDSVTVTFTVGTASPRPVILGLSPVNGANNVTLGSNLLLSFNKAIQKGPTGSFVIKNETDQTTVTKPIASTDIIASGNTVIVSNLGLVYGKTYHVTFDSAAIDSGGYKSYGIYDTTSWRFSTAAIPTFRPQITNLNPADNATGVTPGVTSLTITFNRSVQKGTGNITVYNATDATSQPIAVTSPDVTVSGNFVVVNNVTLLLGKAYYVRFDSAAFDTAGYKSFGIYTDTTWNFSTVAPIVTVTSLNENFDAACASSQLPAGWSKVSVVGAQQWNCLTVTGNSVYQINGFQTTNNANEDWLITPRLNLAAMASPALIFRHWKRFAGDELMVKVSSNYPGYGDPNGSSWTTLNIPMSPADTAVFKTFASSLAAFKAQPFFVAFEYTSTTASGYQTRLDSVVVTDVAAGVSGVSRANTLPVSVIGQATNGHVVVSFDLMNASALQSAIYDMAGRLVYRGVVNGEKGANRVTLTPEGLQSGMYIIRLSNGTQQGIARTFIQ